MTNTYYYARFAENEFELGRFETKAARDAWVAYQDEFSRDMGTIAENAPFKRVAISREQAEQIAGDLVDIADYYENENGIEWLVMIPMFNKPNKDRRARLVCFFLSTYMSIKNYFIVITRTTLK